MPKSPRKASRDPAPDNVIKLKHYEMYSDYLYKWRVRISALVNRTPASDAHQAAVDRLEVERRRIGAGRYTTVRPHIALKALDLVERECKRKLGYGGPKKR